MKQQLEKIPPHNNQAEQSLLSACMLDNQQLEFCSDMNPSELYSLKHQAIFKAMLNMQAKRIPIDLVTITQELRTTGDLETIGAAYLSQIYDAAPFALNTEAYTVIISDLAIKRKAIQIGNNLVNKAFMNGQVAELIDYAQSETLQLQQSKRGDRINFIENISYPHIDNIKKVNATEKERSLVLGFPRLDRVLNIEGSKLIVVAGRPAMGKTAFAVTCMRNLARLGVACGFLSIEMGQEEILNRWLSMETGINSMKFYQHHGLAQWEIEQLEEAAKEMSTWNIQIDDTGSVGIEDVERKTRKMVRNGAKIVFIDQLSKIRGKTGDQFKDYTTNCNRIADLKKELCIPIFLLSQLNRDLEKRTDKRPTLADLKNTGALEEDADAVIFLFRPEYYEKDDHKKAAIKDHAEIAIAKNRNGMCIVDTQVRFECQRGMFYHGEQSY